MSNSENKLNKFVDKNRGIKEIILTLVTIIACIFGILSFHQNKKVNNIISPPKAEKDLSLTLDFNNPLIIKKNNSNKLKIYYEDNEVLNPYSASFTIENTGKSTIKNQDFIEPITITIDDNVKIKDAYVSDSSNKYLSEEVGNSIKFEDNKLIISNFLINSEEKITIIMITNDKPAYFNVNSRFNGIKEIKIHNSPKEKSDKLKETIEKRNQKFKKTIVIFFTISILILIVIPVVLKIGDNVKRKKLIEKFKCLGVEVNCSKAYIDTILEILNNYYLTLQQEDLSEEEIKSKFNEYYQKYKSSIELFNQ